MKRKAPAAPSPTPTDQSSQPSTSTNPSKRKRPRTKANLASPLPPSSSSSSLPPRPPPAPTALALSSKLPPPPPAPAPPAKSNAAARVNHKRKLVPPRPLDSLLPSGSAVTGPTAQIQGRNVVLVSRKSSLGSYMRRCKALMVEEGCSTLTLHGLTASIPHTLLLLHSLLSILPFPPSQISYTTKTTSVRVTDEMVPEDEEEEIELRGRWCAGVEIVLSVGGGGKEGKEGKEKKKKKKGRGKKAGEVAGKGGKGTGKGGSARDGAGAGEGDEDLGEVFVEEDEMDAMNG